MGAGFGFFKELYYTPEHWMSRATFGINFLKFNYASLSYKRVKICLHIGRTFITIKGDHKTYHKIKDMVGLIIGKESGTFKNFK